MFWRRTELGKVGMGKVYKVLDTEILEGGINKLLSSFDTDYLNSYSITTSAQRKSIDKRLPKMPI